MNQYNNNNTNRGALFPRDNEGNESSPTLGGEISVEGVDYWVSGWNNVSKSGKRYISLSLRKKEDWGSQGGGGRSPSRGRDHDGADNGQPHSHADNDVTGDDEDDDIPF